MTSGALCSDHVNYLILRYLQEAGHESAATAFWKDWHRLPEFKDPENYPFAPVVRRGELVNVIQDGLHHDELIARVKKNERKFQFTSVTTREGLERRDGAGAGLENGVGSRPGSSSKRKGGRPVPLRAPDDFPTPAPKRQRRSEGSEGVHVNGDAMDVDTRSGSGDADADEDGEPASPAEGEEVEIVEVPERYDSMDAAVQTIVKAGPEMRTMYWKIDKPDAVIYHSAFSPAIRSDNDKTNALLTVGESLCRFYQVPDDLDDSKKILSIDEPSLPQNSIVTASAWSPDGNSVACAIDTLRELPNGKQANRPALLTHSRETGTSSNYIFPPLLEPDPIVLALRYRTKLLVVRTNLKRGLVLVYETTPEASDPVAWRIFQDPVMDATWTADDEFVVCGENGLVEAYQLNAEKPSISESGFTTDTIATHGLSKSEWLPSMAGTWDKIRYDEESSLVALASTGEKKLATCRRISSGEAATWNSMDLPGKPTAVAFRSNPSKRDGDQTSSPLLAAAFEDGSCVLYTQHPESSEAQSLVTLNVYSSPALALAWSPAGTHLAVSGIDLIQIWEIESLVHVNGESKQLEKKADAQMQALVTWRPDSTATGPRNGEHEGQQLTEPSLSWSQEGSGLVFAVDRQIAVIRFQWPPSLEVKPKVEGEEVNGV